MRSCKWIEKAGVLGEDQNEFCVALENNFCVALEKANDWRNRNILGRGIE